MKVRYIGPSFGAVSLTSNQVYQCVGVEYGLLRIVDDSGEDYLYSAINPAPLDRSAPGGRWEIVEDDENRTLQGLIGA